jgi:hypothetical protein
MMCSGLAQERDPQRGGVANAKLGSFELAESLLRRGAPRLHYTSVHGTAALGGSNREAEERGRLVGNAQRFSTLSVRAH